jgi:hypothetical protein
LRAEQAEAEAQHQRQRTQEAVRHAREQAAAQQRVEEEAAERARRNANDRMHRERLAAEAHRRAEAERLRQQQLVQQAAERQRVQEAARRAHEEAEEARFQDRARENATMTLRRVILGSIITFGAGLEVRNMITGFECCLIKIKNLPGNARDDEIAGLFTQQGVDATRFEIRGVRPMQDGSGRKEANVIMASNLAALFNSALDGIEFRDETIDVEVGAYNMPGGMGMSKPRDAQLMTISWRMPSVRYVAEYDDEDRARMMVRNLNRTVFEGRRIGVEMDAHPRRASVFMTGSNVKINYLPPHVNDAQILELAQTHRVRRLQDRNMYIYASPEGLFHEFSQAIEQCVPGGVVSSERTARERDVESLATYRVRFNTPEQARVIYDRYSTAGFPGLHNLRIDLPDPMTFNLTIPREQHAAQKQQWDALVQGLTDRKACNLIVRPEAQVTRVRLSGSAKTTVGALKVRVEGLATGEPVEGWQRSFAAPNNQFFRRVHHETRAFLRGDGRRQALRVFGTTATMEAAREMVKTELIRLASLEYTITLKQESVGFFSRQGIATLKELVGEDSVTFAPWARRITVTGGEDARHHLHRLIDESLNRGRHGATTGAIQQECPVCSDEVSAPFRLGCGHVYCSPCIRLCLTSAIENAQFPLLCIADSMACATPIAVPTIEDFLPPTTFNQLLESATESYISRNPTIIKYCKTPGCTQVYRSSDEAPAASLQCPSCFTELCASCGEDPHGTVTCAEQKRIQQWDVDEGWMAEQGIRKCPSCSTFNILYIAFVHELILHPQTLSFRRMEDVTTWNAGKEFYLC